MNWLATAGYFEREPVRSIIHVVFEDAELEEDAEDEQHLMVEAHEQENDETAADDWMEDLVLE